MVLIGRLADRLTDSRLVVRCGTLLAVAAVAFVSCWSLAFLLLPLGVLRGRTGGAVLAGGDQAASSFTVELVRIFAVNFALVAIVVVAPNLLRTRRGVPLGYWSATMMIAVAGVVTGTNSFSIQVGSAKKLAPSLELLGNPGPYELAAYVVAATATYGIGRWQLVGRWPHSTAPRLASQPVQIRHVVLGLCAATSILFAMAAWEASRIIADGVGHDRRRARSTEVVEKVIDVEPAADLAGRRTPTQMPAAIERCREEQRTVGNDAADLAEQPAPE